MDVRSTHNGVRSSQTFGVYLNFFLILPTSLFQYGIGRLIILGVFLGYFLSFSHYPQILRKIDQWLGNIALLCRIILFSIIPFAVMLMSIDSSHKVRIADAGVIIALIAGMFWRDTVIVQDRSQRRVRMVSLALVIIALLVPLLDLVSGMLVPKLSDVATTTVDAATLVMQGHNPYAAAIDSYGAANAHDAAFGGYKYLPLLIAIYLPFVTFFGPFATLFVNAVLLAGVCIALSALIRNQAGTAVRMDDRMIAIAVLLATPAIAETALAMGYNDLVGTLLVLAAVAMRGRSALGAGLLVGCSLSCKLMPGLVAATILFPPDRWKAYGIGLAVGMLPILAFLMWDAGAFVRNVLLFNLVRSPDSTSFRLYVPPLVGRIASLAALGFWLASSAWLAIRSRHAGSDHALIDTRIQVFVIATLLLIMTGSTAHDDYMIWWAPAALILFARSDFKRGLNAGPVVGMPA